MKIERKQYLVALGLFHIAQKHQQKCDEIETELNALFDEDNGSHISDAIYNNESLDDALGRMGIAVKEQDDD